MLSMEQINAVIDKYCENYEQSGRDEQQATHEQLEDRLPEAAFDTILAAAQAGFEDGLNPGEMMEMGLLLGLLLGEEAATTDEAGRSRNFDVEAMV